MQVSFQTVVRHRGCCCRAVGQVSLHLALNSFKDDVVRHFRNSISSRMFPAVSVHDVNIVHLDGILDEEKGKCIISPRPVVRLIAVFTTLIMPWQSSLSACS